LPAPSDAPRVNVAEVAEVVADVDVRSDPERVLENVLEVGHHADQVYWRIVRRRVGVRRLVGEEGPQLRGGQPVTEGRLRDTLDQERRAGHDGRGCRCCAEGSGVALLQGERIDVVRGHVERPRETVDTVPVAAGLTGKGRALVREVG